MTPAGEVVQAVSMKAYIKRELSSSMVGSPGVYDPAAWMGESRTPALFRGWGVRFVSCRADG